MSDKSTPSHPLGTSSTTRGRGRGVPGRARGAPSSAGSETRSHAGRPPPKGRGRKPDLMHGLNPEPIHVFDRICDSDGPDVKIENVQLHGSYSWADTKEPTIFVPGSPRLWKVDPTLPMAVPPDSGRTFVDQNRFRLPQSPMLPLFAALDTLETDSDHPKVRWDEVDFVTDRNSLLKLLKFAEPRLPSLKTPTFRIDMQLISPWTILMQRFELASTFNIGPAGITLYADSFEKDSTTPGYDCENSALVSHNRVISCDLGGLKLLVRFEVDACHAPQLASDGSDLDSLANTLSSMNLDSSPTGSPTTKVGPINVIRAGREIAQRDLIKIKTTSRANRFRWDAVYPQLLLGQTPTLKLGVHDNGTFESIVTRELDSPDFESTRKKVDPALSKLRQLLGRVQDAALERGRGATISLVYTDGALKLMERVGRSLLLPPKVIARFDPDSSC